MIDKAALHAELLASVRERRDELIAAHRTSADGAMHEDGRSEGSKDMRATEASYIARGQALRAEALRADVEKIAGMPLRSFGDADPVGLGALVTIEDEQLGRRRLFVAPAGGGTVIGGDVQVTTPSAPLGKALIGARRGDSVELERAGATVELDVVAVR